MNEVVPSALGKIPIPAALLKTLVVLSIPTIVEEVLATLLQYVDTAMVGQLGEQATASVSITTHHYLAVQQHSRRHWHCSPDPHCQSRWGRGPGTGKKAGSAGSVSFRGIRGAVGCGIGAGSALSCPGGWERNLPFRRRPSRYYFISSVLPMVFRAASTIFGCGSSGHSGHPHPQCSSAWRPTG